MSSGIPSITRALVEQTYNNLNSKKTDELYEDISNIFSLKHKNEPDLFFTSPEVPLLDRFKVEGRIPLDFSFNAEQEMVINKLFQKWSLSEDICLIDLLGVDLYQSMKSSLAQDTRSEFMNGMFFLYAYLQRKEMEDPAIQERHAELYYPLEKKYEEFYYLGVDKIISNFKHVKKQIEDARTVKLIQIDSNTKLDFSGKEKLKNIFLAQIQECIQSLDLLIFILKLDFLEILLLDFPVGYFKGGNKLIKGHQTTIADLKVYQNYATELILSGEKTRKIIFNGLNFNFLNLDSPKNSYPKLVDLCKSEIKINTSKQETVIQSFRLARRGELTHADWLQANGLKVVKAKCQAEFAESLCLATLAFATYINFTKDFLKIIDQVILTSYFSNWCTQVDIHARLILNIRALKKNSDHPLRTEIHRLIGSKLDEQFNFLVEPLKSILQNNKDVPLATSRAQLADIIAQRSPDVAPPSSFIIRHRGPDEQSRSFPPTDLPVVDIVDFLDLPLPSLQEMATLIDVFDARIKLLPQILKELGVQFKEMLHTLPREQRNMKFFKQCCFEEAIECCRLVLILNDFRALDGTLDWLSAFPEELADFIELEGLDHIFSPLEEEVDTSPLIASSCKEPSRSAVKQLKNLKVSPKVTKPFLKEEVSEFDPFELGKSRNVRKIIKKLTEAGFFLVRSNGSHQVLKYQGTGGQVIVPNHGELKTGTVASIQTQAIAALQQL